MNLVKLIRKNMTKLMAAFVILIMIAFIMPGLLRQLSAPRSRRNPVMAHYANDGQITSRDIVLAGEELTILRGLYADQFLMRQNDLRIILLGQLLFPESAQTAMISDNIKMMAVRNQLHISPAEVDKFFAQARGRSEIFWLLLKAEAKTFGCGISIESASIALRNIIPQLSDGASQAADLVNALASSRSTTENQVIKTFADLLSILTYNRIATSTEDITAAQLMNTFARTDEKINAEFVKLDSSLFVDEKTQPGQDDLQEHFELYKDYFPGRPDENNPFGFGYKQRAKVAVEYMDLMLKDVEKLVEKPTDAETENFYQRFSARFTEQITIDSNNPDSATTTRQKSYAEVADVIRKGLFQNKINTKATEILGDAMELAEVGFEQLDFDIAKSEDFKRYAGDYVKSAEQTGEKHKINIHTGKTALITAQDIWTNEHLGALAIRGQSQAPTPLATIAFSIDELGVTTLGPFDIQTPKMYQSIGPMNDGSGQIVAMIRIIAAAKAAVPEDINLTYAKNLPKILSDANDAEDDIYSLKKLVIDDYKRLKVTETAKAKADELVIMVADSGWDKAIEKFNRLYAKDDAQAVELTILNEARRISEMDIEIVRSQFSNNPVADDIVNGTIIQKKLMDKFYSLLGPAEADLSSTPAVVEYKAQACCYVIKSLSRTIPNQADYDKVRAQLAYRQEYIEGQNAALKILMPENIIRRMEFKWAEPAGADDDANSTEEADGDI
jgi:hypothetical protein